jgi:outer membrane lipoprotein carrier protein
VKTISLIRKRFNAFRIVEPNPGSGLIYKEIQSRLNGAVLPFLLLSAVLFNPPEVFAGRGDEIVKKVQETFAGLKTLSVRFDMQYQVPESAEIQRETGRFWMDDRGRFRTETQRQTVVCDGRTVWMYNPDQKQVIIRSVADGTDDLVTPGKLLYDYPDLYSVVEIGEDNRSGKTYTVLVMKPKSETDPTREIKVWIDPDDFLTRRFMIVDLADNVTLFDFLNYELNQPIPEDTFTFLPPEGTEIFDLR